MTWHVPTIWQGIWNIEYTSRRTTLLTTINYCTALRPWLSTPHRLHVWPWRIVVSWHLYLIIEAGPFNGSQHPSSDTCNYPLTCLYLIVAFLYYHVEICMAFNVVVVIPPARFKAFSDDIFITYPQELASLAAVILASVLTLIVWMLCRYSLGAHSDCYVQGVNGTLIVGCCRSMYGELHASFSWHDLKCRIDY